MAQMKKKTTAKWLKVSLAQNPWLSGTKLKKRDYCAQFTTREDVIPRPPSALPTCTPRSFIQASQSCRQKPLAPLWPQFRCVGTWVCRWRTLRGTGERDNLRVSPFSGVIQLVIWDTFALRMRLTQWVVSLIPLFSFLRTTQTLFDAIITVKGPVSTAPSLPAATSRHHHAKVQFRQIGNNHLSRRTNPQAQDQHLFYLSMQRMSLSLTNYLSKNKIKIMGPIHPCLLSHSKVLFFIY